MIYRDRFTTMQGYEFRRPDGVGRSSANPSNHRPVTSDSGLFSLCQVLLEPQALRLVGLDQVHSNLRHLAQHPQGLEYIADMINP